MCVLVFQYLLDHAGSSEWENICELVSVVQMVGEDMCHPHAVRDGRDVMSRLACGPLPTHEMR
jgi:hypothetical protein